MTPGEKQDFWQPWSVAAALALLFVGPNRTAADNRRQNGTAEPPIAIFDARGTQVNPGVVSQASHTVDVTVGPGLIFSPSSVNIVTGDSVRWTWSGNNHTVTSGNFGSCTIDNHYCSPSDVNCPTAAVSNTGATYSHTFTQAGTFPYFCRVHCAFGMTGTVNVVAPFVTLGSVTHPANGHFLINGTSLPNVTLTVKSTPSLLSAFGNPQPVSTNANGVFQFDDASAVGQSAQFYQVTYP
jgi:plastocyanin